MHYKDRCNDSLGLHKNPFLISNENLIFALYKEENYASISLFWSLKPMYFLEFTNKKIRPKELHQFSNFPLEIFSRIIFSSIQKVIAIDLDHSFGGAAHGAAREERDTDLAPSSAESPWRSWEWQSRSQMGSHPIFFLKN